MPHTSKKTAFIDPDELNGDAFLALPAKQQELLRPYLKPGVKAWLTIKETKTPDQIRALFSEAAKKANETRKLNREAAIAELKQSFRKRAKSAKPRTRKTAAPSEPETAETE